MKKTTSNMIAGLTAWPALHAMGARILKTARARASDDGEQATRRHKINSQRTKSQHIWSRNTPLCVLSYKAGPYQFARQLQSRIALPLSGLIKTQNRRASSFMEPEPPP